MKKGRVTAESEAIASNNTSLNDGILLSGKGFGEESQFGHETRPRLHEEEPKQPSRDVQRRDDPDRQIELVGDDAEKTSQHRTHQQPSDGDLVLPFRDTLGFR